MSYLELDLAREQHQARLVEAEESRRSQRAATAQRLQRRAARLARKAERFSARAERTASRARLAVARAL